MSRPRKCRKVCQMPQTREFVPLGGSFRGRVVVLTVDEYEAVRLIDFQGFSQEECSNYMKVSRTTAQMIYNSARKKLAQALVGGLPLRIEGGDYQLCDGSEEYCDCGGCKRHRHAGGHISEEEDNDMKIAVPLDENRTDVCIVLARAPYFLIRSGEGDVIVENPATQANSGAGMQAAQFLVDSKIDVLITVRCGENAQEVFGAAGIKIYKSENKTALEDLACFEQGKLSELTQFHGGYHGRS